MFVPNHKHLVLNLTLFEAPTKSITAGNSFMLNVVKEVGMVPVTAPRSAYVDEIGNKGLTGSINLATSHFAYHIWDETGLMMCDLYSCKCFAASQVLDLIREYFGPYQINCGFFIDRETAEVTFIT